MEHFSRSEKRRTKRATGKIEKSFAECLEETAKIFSKTLDEDLVNVWSELLNYCSTEEAVSALKQWQFQGGYFPKPAEILQLVANGRDAERMKGQAPGCSNCHDGYVITNPDAKPSDYIVRRCECVTRTELRSGKRHLHQSYDWNDIKFLWKKRMLDAGKSWTPEQWEQALQELDSKRRDGPPPWRRQLETQPDNQS